MSYIEDVKVNRQIISSYDDNNNPEVKKIMFNIMQNKQESLSQMVGQQFRIVNYIAQYSRFRNEQQPDETAEDAYKDGMKIAIQTDFGGWYSGSGDAILNAIENYEQLFGKISAENPMDVRVLEIKSGKNDKFKYISFELV